MIYQGNEIMPIDLQKYSCMVNSNCDNGVPRQDTGSQSAKTAPHFITDALKYDLVQKAGAGNYAGKLNLGGTLGFTKLKCDIDALMNGLQFFTDSTAQSKFTGGLVAGPLYVRMGDAMGASQTNLKCMIPGSDGKETLKVSVTAASNSIGSALNAKNAITPGDVMSGADFAAFLNSLGFKSCTYTAGDATVKNCASDGKSADATAATAANTFVTKSQVEIGIVGTAAVTFLNSYFTGCTYASPKMTSCTAKASPTSFDSNAAAAANGLSLTTTATVDLTKLAPAAYQLGGTLKAAATSISLGECIPVGLPGVKTDGMGSPVFKTFSDKQNDANGKLAFFTDAKCTTVVTDAGLTDTNVVYIKGSRVEGVTKDPAKFQFTYVSSDSATAKEVNLTTISTTPGALTITPASIIKATATDIKFEGGISGKTCSSYVYAVKSVKANGKQIALDSDNVLKVGGSSTTTAVKGFPFKMLVDGHWTDTLNVKLLASTYSVEVAVGCLDKGIGCDAFDNMENCHPEIFGTVPVELVVA
ncbi:hypothetical protein MIDIC_430003 [Alphaproteobacteria bacterium]